MPVTKREFHPRLPLFFRPRLGAAVFGAQDNHLWLELWNTGEIEFHQTAVNPRLVRFWHELNSPRVVFVPFCGKSLDMRWLAARGHDVIGVELSPLAAEAFFAENQLRVHRDKVGPFLRFRSGTICILCGDYFQLDRATLGSVDAVYDCAAVAALSQEVRPDYVAHLRALVPLHAEIFLLTIEDTEHSRLEPSPAEAESEVTALYGQRSAVVLRHHELMSAGDPLRSADATLKSAHNVYHIRFA